MNGPSSPLASLRQPPKASERLAAGRPSTRRLRFTCSAIVIGLLVAAGAAPTAQPAAAAPTPMGSERTRVMVLLRRSPGPATTSAVARADRAAVVAHQEAPAIAQVRSHGGVITGQYSLISGFSATVSPSEVPALRARQDVAAVVPDRLIQLPRPRSSTPPTSPVRSLPSTSSQVCPADPAKPLLEPEALSLMRAASTDPSIPSAADLADGAGVTVGIIGNGIDVANPDLVRPDGSHVVMDYRDFVGTGTNAPAAASESMGDAASIAAQARETYDLAGFGAVPSGCTIRVRGVAPAARVVALKVTDGRSFYDSALVEAIDYAVSVDHVDVLNESLADDPYPDTGADPLTLANAAAVAAGVTITSATGDGGPNSTIGPPSSSLAGAAGIISTGASTQLQLVNQLGFYGPGAAVRSGDIANFSSDGVAQTGRTVDVVAPGSDGWSVCTDDPARYLDCPDLYPAGAKGLQAFAGTSESAPLTAGVAALIIQRYRQTHDGASPTPRLVKQIVTSTADDLGAPAQEQGAGQVDARRAVQLAAAVRDGSASEGSADVLVSPTTVSSVAGTGGRRSASLTLQNPTSRRQRLVLTRRDQRLTGVSRQTTDVPAAHVVRLSFTVTPRTDRVVVSASLHTSTGDYPELVLFDPDNVVANDSTSDGPTSTNTVEADRPHPGTWHVYVLTYAYAGQADLAVASYRNATHRLARVTLPPAGHRSVRIRLPHARPGDEAYAVTVRSAASSTVRTSVPVVVRTPVTPRSGRATFRGAVAGGNGRGGVLFGTSTYLVRVLAHTAALRAQIRLAHGGQRIDAYLTSPSGNTLDESDNLRLTSDDPARASRELNLATVHPEPGLWQLAIGLNGVANPVHPATRFVGRIRLEPPPIQVSGLPTSPRQVLRAGVRRTVTVHVRNDAGVARAYVLDPRLTTSSWTTLAQPATVTISSPDTSPALVIAVPPQTTELSTTMTAPRALAGSVAPANFSFVGGNSDPEVYDTSPSGTLRLDIQGRELQNGPWLELPTPAGPFSAAGIANPLTVDLHAAVRTQTFDPSITRSTGDPWTGAVGRHQPVAPLVLAAGASADIRVALSPAGRPGHLVRGTLAVLEWDARAGVTSTQARFPYSYRVG